MELCTVMHVSDVIVVAEIVEIVMLNASHVAEVASTHVVASADMAHTHMMAATEMASSSEVSAAAMPASVSTTTAVPMCVKSRCRYQRRTDNDCNVRSNSAKHDPFPFRKRTLAINPNIFYRGKSALATTFARMLSNF